MTALVARIEHASATQTSIFLIRGLEVVEVSFVIAQLLRTYDILAED